jgi:HNH endonuclease
MTRTCIYCGLDKPNSNFSDEHIWPEALGGDFLPPLWRTDDVCRECNNMSGIFVDGAFIKSWITNAERTIGAREYIDVDSPSAGILPLSYLGPLSEVPIAGGEVAEYWAGPCGANIIHIRPRGNEEHWETFVGGDPRARRSQAGRAYIALTSKHPFWICVSLWSFQAHFKKAERFVVNVKVSKAWYDVVKNIDRDDPAQTSDLRTVDAVVDASRDGKSVLVSPLIPTDLGSRFLAKIGLAIGYKLLGSDFLQTQPCTNAAKSI